MRPEHSRENTEPIAPIARVDPIRTGITIGFLAIFAGGMIAAITAPLNLEKGSWLAAYLTLVAGLTQLLLSHQHQILRLARPASRPLWIQLALWIAGNLLVIVGSLATAPLAVDLGGAILVVALLIALKFSVGTPLVWRAWPLRLFYTAVIISTPIGLVLAHTRV